MAQAGAAVVVPDAELTPARLASEVDALLADRARLAAMGRASARAGAARRGQRIAEEVLAAARWSRSRVGARGDRAERERGDHEQGGGEGAPAMGGDGLHHRP